MKKRYLIIWIALSFLPLFLALILYTNDYSQKNPYIVERGSCNISTNIMENEKSLLYSGFIKDDFLVIDGITGVFAGVKQVNIYPRSNHFHIEVEAVPLPFGYDFAVGDRKFGGFRVAVPIYTGAKDFEIKYVTFGQEQFVIWEREKDYLKK